MGTERILRRCEGKGEGTGGNGDAPSGMHGMPIRCWRSRRGKQFLCCLFLFFFLSVFLPSSRGEEGKEEKGKERQENRDASRKEDPLMRECVTARTIPDCLNVRIRPDLSATSVALLSAGSEVKVLAEKGQWLEILLPENAVMWVSALFLDEDGIPEEGSILRSGPSVAYEAYGSIGPTAGKLTVLEHSRSGKWLRIVPLKGFSGYVNAKYVQFPEEEAEKKSNEPQLSGMKDRLVPSLRRLPGERGLSVSAAASYAVIVHGRKEEERRTADPPPPPPQQVVEEEMDSFLLPAMDPFLDGLEKNVSMEGVLLPLPDGGPLKTVFFSHVLAIRIHRAWYPFAYILGGSHGLNLWEHRAVRITGVQRWMKNCSRPCLEVTEIAPVWRQPEEEF